MTDTPNLQLSLCKVTVQHLAQYSPLTDAESLLRSLRETVAFLERRVAREKVEARKLTPVLVSRIEAKAS
jgi:hypothetical protein